MYGTQHQRAVLRALSPELGKVMRVYELKPRTWTPTEILLPIPRTIQLPPAIVAALGLNLLTEEGLPHFVVLLTTLGLAGPWRDWASLWASEEQAHSVLLRGLLERIPIVDMVVVDKMQRQYTRNGFMPSWQTNPYCVIAYTVIQELATQLSYDHIVALVRSQSMSMETAKHVAGGVATIARDEARHAATSWQLFELILNKDPIGALEAMSQVMHDFCMPGVAIEGFDDLAYLQRRLGIFGPSDYAKLVGETILRIERRISGLGGQGEIEHLLGQMRQTHRALRRLLPRFDVEPTRTLTFSFLPETKFVL